MSDSCCWFTRVLKRLRCAVGSAYPVAMANGVAKQTSGGTVHGGQDAVWLSTPSAPRAPRLTIYEVPRVPVSAYASRTIPDALLGARRPRSDGARELRLVPLTGTDGRGR